MLMLDRQKIFSLTQWTELINHNIPILMEKTFINVKQILSSEKVQKKEISAV